MNKNSKLYAILSYITWVGWLIAFFCREKDDTLVRKHLNQGLVLAIVGTVCSALSGAGGLIAVIFEIVDLACLILAIMGIVRAAKLSEEPLPLIGNIEWIK